jgi:hypothetical protein
MHIRMKIIVAVMGLSTFGVVALTATPRPLPSDGALRARFLAHRADFERLELWRTKIAT